jgi:hypothetical protein
MRFFEHVMARDIAKALYQCRSITARVGLKLGEAG